MKEWNDVFDYIEKNLEGEISLKRISELSMLSVFNFQKIFTVLTGISLGEYIRRRKLSSSLYYLCETDKKIIDIAALFGYESPNVYGKAFKKLFGVTPRAVRSNQLALVSYPKFTVKLMITGGMAMNYRVEKKASFQVIGKLHSFENIMVGQKKIAHLWSVFIHSKAEEELLRFQSQNKAYQGFLGLCVPSVDNEAYQYMIGVVADETSERFDTVKISAGSWLVFEAETTNKSAAEAIHKTYQEIYQTFLPSSKYTLRNAPDFEFYASGNPDKNGYITELWIPIN